MRNPFSIRSAMAIKKRVFFLLIVVFIPLLLLQTFTFYRWYQARKETEMQANLELARAVSKNFETFLQGLIRSEQALGLALTASRTMTNQDRDQMLDTIHAANPAARSTFWMNRDGVVVASSLRTYIGFNLSDRSFYQTVKEGRDWAVSELVVGKATGKPAFTVSRGIRDQHGELLGVVAVSVEPDLLDSVLAIPRSKNAGVSLIDNKGMLVYRYPVTKLTWEQRNWLKLYPVLDGALKGKDVVVGQASGITGERRLVAFTPVSSIGWVASCSQAEHEVMAAIIATLLPQATAMLLLTLAVFGAALGLSRPITASILHLRDRARALGRGEREGVIIASGPRELRDLGDTFNQMAAEVRFREEALRQSEQRWSTTLSSIGDAVIATDATGGITFMNSVAQEMTGWTLEEASLMPVTEIFNIINEHTRKEVESPVVKVLREGMVVGLANHTILVRKDGTEVPIDDSGAPIKDKDGNTTGVVLVFRDITERKLAEEAARESQRQNEFLANIIALGSQPFGVGYPDGSLGLVNKAFEQLTGYGVEELRSIDWATTLTPPEWVESERQKLEELHRTGKPVRYEKEYLRKDGSRVPIELLVHLVADHDGQPQYYYSFITDITERKRTEEITQHLASFPQLNPSPIIEVDISETITFSNPGAQALLENLGLDKGAAGALLPHDLDAILRNWDKKSESTLDREVSLADRVLSETVQLVPHFNVARIYAQDITARKQAEHERELAVQFLRTINESTSKQDLVRGAATFFQEQSGMEAVGIRLKEGDDYPYYETHGFPGEFVRLESSVCLRDDEGRTVRDDSGFPIMECMCGNILRGRFDPSLPFFTEHGSFWSNCTSELLATSTEEDRQARTRNRCNGEGYESVALVALRAGDECLGLLQLNDRRPGRFTPERVALYERLAGYLAVALAKVEAEEALRAAHDKLEMRVKDRTTELQQAYDRLKEETEQRGQIEAQLRQAQKMEALGTMSGGIAHDFNNILAAIIGFAELLEGQVTKGSRDARRLDRIMEAAIRGRELVRQMLTFSRKAEQEKKPLPVGSIVKETVKLLRATTPSTINIRVNVSSDALILGDPTQIQQVLMNLCTNAAHAMRDKGGDLEIDLSEYRPLPSNGDPHGIEPGNYVRLTVRDTGTGMPTDIIDKIFDPFFTTKKLGEGTGLGLSVVHGIVKQHDGAITVASEQGRGSTFTLYFPQIMEGLGADADHDDDIPTGSERILFVDDEEALVEMGEDILAELGYDVVSRMGSRDALALLKSDPSRFDLVITDQTMPEMTGVELAKEIFGLRPDMPVIMCTGFSHVVDADKAMAAGIKAFAMKPLTKREIAKTIRKVLDG